MNNTQLKLILTSGLLALGCTSLVACTSPLDSARYENWQDHNPFEWRATDEGSAHRTETLRTRIDSTDEDPDETGTALPPEMTADDYVALALKRNPSIRAAEHRVDRLSARIAQVTSLDDPRLQVAPFGEMAQTAAGEVGLMMGLSQKLPYPGKLATKGRIAEQDVAMALADRDSTRLRVAAETRRSFWNFYFSTRAIETTRASRTLLMQFKRVAETEYRAGIRTQSDVLRASVELSNLDNELITLAQRQATAQSMLNQLMDRPVDETLPAPAPISLQAIVGNLDEFLATSAQANPGIRKIYERIEQFRERQALARLGRRPDLTASTSYNIVRDQGLAKGANGDDQWWFGFSINLPIWDARYDAAERAALEGIMEGVASLTAERNRVAFQVNDAFLRVESQQDLVELFRDVIVPQARQTVDASASGYRAGSVDFLTLIDNWRKLLNFDIMYHRALAEMEQAAADLERAVGTELTRTSQEH